MDYITSGNITTDDFLAMFGNTSSMFNQLPSQSSPSPYSPNETLNISANNDTQLQGVYPSGYTITHIVFASIVVTILMIMIVVGNMLVIIAIATEKSLKNIQNWFIASLAVADFFLGLIIMPFSLANELMGYWIFGNWWCDIHSAMDVLLCTASINNLCLISLDRYWSITKAVEYLKTRTPARAALMIAAVWIISGLICIPPLLGWKVKRDEGQALPQCQLSEDIGYVLYSALGSFYIPSCIMVFVYIRIYFAAKRRARRGIKKLPRKPASEQKVTSFTVSPGKGGSTPMPSVPSASTSKQQQIATIESVPSGKNPRSIPIPIVTCDLASDLSSEACDGDNMNGAQDTLKVSTIAATHSTMTIRSSNGTTSGGQSNELQIGGNTSTVINRNRALSVGIDTDMVSEFDPSSSDSGVVSRCAVVKPLKFKLCQPIFGKKHQQKKREAKQLKQQQLEQQKQAQQMNQIHHNLHQTVDTTEIEPVIPKVQKPRDPEKEKRRIARKKEKRATLILGLIMGSFIASWLPFFFLYILKPACKFCVIPESAFAVAFWLGYMNSALNPAIYTIFNKDFRRAFRRILFK